MKNKIKADLVFARRHKLQLEANVLRQVIGEITTLEKSPKYKGETTNEDVLTIIRRLVKQRTEASVIYAEGGSPAMAQIEITEREIIEAYLPSKLTGDGLRDLVECVVVDLGATSMKDMGKVMKQCKEAGYEIDGKELSTLVRGFLA